MPWIGMLVLSLAVGDGRPMVGLFPANHRRWLEGHSISRWELSVLQQVLPESQLEAGYLLTTTIDATTTTLIDSMRHMRHFP